MLDAFQIYRILYLKNNYRELQIHGEFEDKSTFSHSTIPEIPENPQKTKNNNTKSKNNEKSKFRQMSKTEHKFPQHSTTSTNKHKTLKIHKIHKFTKKTNLKQI